MCEAAVGGVAGDMAEDLRPGTVRIPISACLLLDDPSAIGLCPSKMLSCCHFEILGSDLIQSLPTPLFRMISVPGKFIGHRFVVAQTFLVQHFHKGF
jgi:hypothetical protein